jgi:kynurenine formamidase
MADQPIPQEAVMNLGLYLEYLGSAAKVDRREVLSVAAKSGVAGAIAAFGLLGPSSPSEARGRRGCGGGPFTDAVFDYANPANLSDWVPGPYGPHDERGSFNEVTSERTTDTIRRVIRGRRVKTYNLGELMWNGFPAFVTTPARGHHMRMTLTGYPPPPNFEANGGYVTSLTPIGSNQVSVHEERFPSIPGVAPAGATYQIATQLDNLNHVGAGPFFYNGNRGPDFLTAFGTTRLGGENMGPIVTRGIVIDILGLKIAQGAASALGPPAPNGKPVLTSNYRITIADIEAALDRERIRSIEPGDVVLFRTGWNQLLQGRTPAGITRWNGAGGLPGIYVAEGHYLAACRPAIVASDTWALEVLGSPDNIPGTAFPVHQDLLMRYGIRIGESIVVDELVEDGVYECLYMVTPQFVEGSTCGNAPPAALAQPRN